MSAPLLAHAAHWATTLAFFGPVVLLPLGLYAIALRERRRGARLDTAIIDEEQ